MVSRVIVWDARGEHGHRLYDSKELPCLEGLDKAYHAARRMYKPHKSKYKKTGKHDYPKDVGDTLLDARSGRLVWTYHNEIDNALKGAKKGIESIKPRRRLPTV